MEKKNLAVSIILWADFGVMAVVLMMMGMEIFWGHMDPDVLSREAYILLGCWVVLVPCQIYRVKRKFKEEIRNEIKTIMEENK